MSTSVSEMRCGCVALQGGADTSVLLQLPHFDYDVLKKLGRKKMRSLAELAAMDPEERLELFVTSGEAPPSSWLCFHLLDAFLSHCIVHDCDRDLHLLLMSRCT